MTAYADFAPARPRRARPQYAVRFDVGTILILAIGAMEFFLAPPVLFMLAGIDYVGPSGSTIQKIHPATYVALPVACGILALYALRPHVRRLAPVHLLHIAFFIVTAGLIVRNTLYGTQSLSLLIDTFLMAAAFLIIVDFFSRANPVPLYVCINIAMLVNSLMGIAEYGTGVKVLYWYIYDWRAYALFGHPLINSIVTGSFILSVICAALTGYRGFAIYTLPVHTIAMLAFGGRAGSVTLIGMLGLVIVATILRALWQRGMSAFAMILVTAGLAFGAAVVGLVFASDLFGPFLERFDNDNGSALARAIVFALLETVSWTQILLGMDTASLSQLQTLYGIEYGLEIFWISMIMFYGLLFTIPLFLTFIAVMFEPVRYNVFRVFSPLFFVIVATTSLSLAAKTPMLVMYLMIEYAVFHPRMRISGRVPE